MTYKDARRGDRTGRQAGRGAGGDVAVLEAERKFYDSKKSDLVRDHAGQFALIHDSELVGTFTTFTEAYEEGVRRFGITPFLVQQVREQEPTAQIPALVVGVLSSR